jgi:hypothetical protein
MLGRSTPSSTPFPPNSTTLFVIMPPPLMTARYREGCHVVHGSVFLVKGGARQKRQQTVCRFRRKDRSNHCVATSFVWSLRFEREEKSVFL